MPLHDRMPLIMRNTSSAFYFFLILGFIGLWCSPFVVSCATGFSIIYFIVSYKRLTNVHIKRICLVLVLILLLGLFDFILHGYSSELEAKFLLMIGLFFMMCSSFVLFNERRAKLIQLALILSGVVVVINIIALTNYLLDKAHYDALLLQSKSIPIPNMHHIHFGIINACIIVLLGGLTLYRKFNNPIQITLSRIMLVIVFFCFHIFSSRTGMLSFYVGTTSALFAYSIQTGSYRLLLYSSIAIITVLISSFYWSQSFRNKLDNTIEDYRSWGKGDEINHKSMAMRMEASKMAIQIIKENPFGVGVEARERVLQKMYVTKRTPLDKKNRLGPHNQFLEYGMKYGWIGIVVLFLFFLSFIPLINQTFYPFMGLIVLLFTALFFESLLERQVSIYFISLFVPLFSVLFKK